MDNAHRKIGYLGMLAFLLTLHVADAQQTGKPTTPLKGVVQTWASPHKPIAYTEMGIRGVDSVDTSDQGVFTLGIPEAAKPLHVVVTFYVKNWKVIQPSLNGKWGDSYLPPPNAGDVTLLVAAPGQREIWLADASIETMLLGATYHFKKVTSLEQETSLSANGAPLTISARLGMRASLLEGEEALARKYFSQWLDNTATEIDISRSDIETAISSWIGRAQNDFDRGLGFLYRGNVTSAIAALEKARGAPNQKKELYIATYQALAFGYVLQRNYVTAEELLRKGFAETGSSDQNFLDHLGNVLILDGKPDEANKAFNQARTMLKRNGIGLSKPMPKPSADSIQNDHENPRPPPPSHAQTTIPQTCPQPSFPSPKATAADAGPTSCGPQGNGGNETNQNLAKNNFCATPNQQGQPNPADFQTMQQLQTAVNNDHSIAFGDKGTATRPAGPQVDRTKLQQRGEGRLAVIEGIVLKARQEGGEGVNCKGHVPELDAYHDIHISLVPPGADVECDGIVLEMTPHHRPSQWTQDNVMQFAQGKRVRVFGQMMFDSSHFPCVNGQPVGTNPKRMSLWEIHPIYRFEVCTANCNTDNPAWATLEDLVDRAARHGGR